MSFEKKKMSFQNHEHTYKSACLFSGLERPQQIPFTASSSMLVYWGFFYNQHASCSYLFHFISVFFLQRSFSAPDSCFLIFFRTVPFANPCCTVLEVEQGFSELCGFLSTPSPLFEYLFSVRHFGGLMNRLQRQGIRACQLVQ